MYFVGDRMMMVKIVLVRGVWFCVGVFFIFIRICILGEMWLFGRFLEVSDELLEWDI